MTNRILFGLLLLALHSACSGTPYPGLQVEVKRDGKLYAFTASFDTPLSKCAAYQYLTDYDAAKNLPGVVESIASRQSSNTVKVERTADERVLFFHVRLHTVMEYTENPTDSISFTQISGDSKSFQGNWHILPRQQGSTIKFQGSWEPDTLIPLFVIDHFAENDLAERFSAVAKLAEARSETASAICTE
jgi:ribosome-associated toxin RatA of RatAB toxin-antitoxin module